MDDHQGFEVVDDPTDVPLSMQVEELEDGLYALPMDDFLQVVIARSQGKTSTGPWRSPLFQFTRLVKGRPEFAGMDGYAVADHVEPRLRYLAPEGEDPWKYHFEHMGTHDGRAEFIDTWGRIRTPANMDVLQSAARIAGKRPLVPIKRFSGGYCRFISIAGVLQKILRNKPIALPVERLAELLECDRRTITTYLRFAIQEELLKKVKDCKPHQLAAEFRFAVERFDWKNGRQIQ